MGLWRVPCGLGVAGPVIRQIFLPLIGAGVVGVLLLGCGDGQRIDQGGVEALRQILA